MFINTMAVGPFEPVELCVTGGATVTIDDRRSHGRAFWQVEALGKYNKEDLRGS